MLNFVKNLFFRPDKNIKKTHTQESTGPILSQGNSSDLRVNIIEAFSVLPLMTGGKMQVFINDKYSFGEFSEFPVGAVNSLMILQFAERFTTSEEFLGTMMVSDGFTSHSVSPTKVIREDSFRLYYSDPWGDRSFLEEGNNILGISARKENGREFSISYSEYEMVIVAYGFVRLTEQILGRDKE